MGGLLVVHRPPILGLILILGSLGMVIASVPLAGLGLWVTTRYGPAAIPVVAFGLALTSGLIGGFVVFVVSGVSLDAVLLAGSSIVVIGLLEMVIPLTLGWVLSERWTASFRSVLIAWPLTLATGFALFVAPGGVSRYNALFLDEPTRTVYLTGILLVVLLGPGVIGSGLRSLWIAVVHRFDR